MGVFNLLDHPPVDGQFNFGQGVYACAVFQDCCSGFVDRGALTCRSLKLTLPAPPPPHAHITGWDAPRREGGNVSPAGVVRIFGFARNTRPSETYHNIYSFVDEQYCFLKKPLYGNRSMG